MKNILYSPFSFLMLTGSINALKAMKMTQRNKCWWHRYSANDQALEAKKNVAQSSFIRKSQFKSIPNVSDDS